MFLDHTQRRSTVGRTPLDEWSARRRDLYLTTHDNHNRQISMPLVGFERKISAGERLQVARLLRKYFSIQCSLFSKRTLFWKVPMLFPLVWEGQHVDEDYSNIFRLPCINQIQKYKNSQQNELQCFCFILFTIFSPTRFGRYFGHLQCDVLITRIQL